MYDPAIIHLSIIMTHPYTPGMVSQIWVIVKSEVTRTCVTSIQLSVTRMALRCIILLNWWNWLHSGSFDRNCESSEWLRAYINCITQIRQWLTVSGVWGWVIELTSVFQSLWILMFCTFQLRLAALGNYYFGGKEVPISVTEFIAWHTSFNDWPCWGYRGWDMQLTSAI